VLLIEYIQVNKISDNSPEYNIIYLEIIHKFIISSYFIKQTFHADLHLGNIFFIKNNDQYQLGIIDFGLIGHLDNVCEQDFLYDLLNAYANNDSIKLVDSILDYLQIINNLTFDDLFKSKIYQLTNILDIFQPSASITHYDIFTFIQLLKQNNLKISKRLSFLLLSVVSQSGSINKLKENCLNIDLNLLIKKITDNLIK
jgi:predicted unusual protein kinase regulating ubiquinone biosynthesis (AarF/ABC1/UbiB family)